MSKGYARVSLTLGAIVLALYLVIFSSLGVRGVQARVVVDVIVSSR